MEILPLIMILIIGLSFKKKISQAMATKEGVLKKSGNNSGSLIKNIFDEFAKEIARQKELNKANFGKIKKKNPSLNKTGRLKVDFKPQKRETIRRPKKQVGYDKRIVFILPLFLVLLSLIVSKIKIGGTIMSNLHGWPYPFFIHQIKDVVDGFPIDKWLFSPGSFYHYIIFNYLFFLIVTLFIYSLVKINNRK